MTNILFYFSCKAAYKDADGLKILGRRILVDVERARTVKGWKPRRLGGGLGGREQKSSGSHHHGQPYNSSSSSGMRNSSRDKYSDSRDRHRQPSGYRRDDDRKRPRMRSRSRSPKPFKDRPYGSSSSSGRRERSRDRMGSSSRRDRY